MDTSASQPPPPPLPSPSGASGLGRLVAGIAIVFVGVAIVAGLLARQSSQEAARLSAGIDALQQEVGSLRREVQALAAESERSAVLSFTDGGYFPIRTNAGTLLVAVADVEPVDSSLRVHLRLGNPQAMTYLGYTLAFSWDKGRGQQAFREPLEPGAWAVVPVMLSPADAERTRSLTITEATVDEIAAR